MKPKTRSKRQRNPSSVRSAAATGGAPSAADASTAWASGGGHRAGITGWMHRHARMVGGLIFTVVLVVFLPVVRNGFICYDDNGYVTENAWVQRGLNWGNIVHAFRTTEIAYWHPLTWISHLIDVALYGLHPWGHHLTSALLHALNALLLFMLMRALTGAVVRGAIVALLFGLHPLHVESVVWVAERKDVLSTAWALLSLWCYARWAGRASGPGGRDGRFYGCSLLAFAAGLMSKPMVVTLPCVMLLLDFWPLERWRTIGGGRVLLEKIPFLALAAIDGLVTVHAQAALGTLQTVARYPWSARLTNALASYAGYLGKCFLPTRLAVYYPYPDQPAVVQAILGGIVLTTVSVAAWRAREKRPWLLVGWLWFVGTLVPVIGLVQVGGQAMADRYTYLPLVGIFLAATWTAGAVLDGGCPRWLRGATVVGVVALFASLAGATIRQLTYWRDSPALFRHALAVTGENWCAHNCLGYYYAHTPDGAAESIAQYRATLALQPTFADAHYSLATVLARNSESRPEAIVEYRTALRLNPRFPGGQLALGKAFEQIQGHRAEAISAYRSAIELDPADADAHNRLGNLLADSPGTLAAAIVEYQQTLRLRPDWVEVRANLGSALAHSPGRLPEAVAEYRALLLARPGYAEAHNNLANALARTPGHEREAAAEYEAALRLRPDYFEAEYNYGAFLSARPGREADAIAHLESALRLQPDLEIARTLIARLRTAQTR